MVEGRLYMYLLGHSRSFWNVQGKTEKQEEKRSCLPLWAPVHSLQGVPLPTELLPHQVPQHGQL